MVDKKEIIRELEKVGRKAYKHINNGKYPKLKYPTSSKKNIEFDPETEKYKFKGKKSILDSGNVSQVSFWARLVKLAQKSKELVKKDRSASMREVFYMMESWQKPLKVTKDTHGQKYTNRLIERLEKVTGFPREELGFYAEEKGKLYGDISIRKKRKKINPLDTGMSIQVPTSLKDITITDINADYVILLEAKAAMKRLQEKIPDELSAVVISAGGYSPRSVISFLKRIDKNFDVHLFHCVDLDHHGIEIYSTTSKYSVSSSHIKNHNVSGLKYLGVSGKDADKYFEGDEDVFGEEKENNIKACKRKLNNLEEGKDLRWSEKEVKETLEWIIENKKTLELQAFAKHSLDAFAEYVQEKVEKLT